MFQIVQEACNLASQAGCTYADARVVALRRQTLDTRDRAVEHYGESDDRGFGVRVLYKGAWGFASSPILKLEEVKRVVKQAIRVAEASALALRKGGVQWAPEPATRIHHVSPRQTDPFEVPFDSKTSLLLDAAEVMLKFKGIKRARGYLLSKEIQRWYANTDGSEMFSDVISTEAEISAVAVGEHDFQSRSWHADCRSGGFELYDRKKFLVEAERIASQARQKLSAVPAPSGEKDLVLDSHHLGLTIHESVGHATELDRVLGYEVSMAGSSFVSTDKLGKFRYGSDKVTLMADNTLEGGLATQGFDDDGVAGQRWPIVENGLFKGYSTGREFAHAIGETRSRGCCRADHWSSFPIVRIPNLSLMPGQEACSPQQLIGGVEDGLYFEGMGSFSIDQRRWNFQFGADAVWEIKGGQLGNMVKPVVYQSTTPYFWGQCDAVADKNHWRPVGVMNCGKGDPMQIAQMTHGASPARFRKIKVSPGSVSA